MPQNVLIKMVSKVFFFELKKEKKRKERDRIGLITFELRKTRVRLIMLF